jgi:quinol monooxygenase YgiN
MELSQVALNMEDQQETKSRIDASIRMIIPAKKRKEALIILSSLIEQTRLEEGCISCRLYQDAQEQRALLLEEIWTSKKDLERHLRSDKFLAVLLVVEMAIESPEIRFDVISHSTGIDAIEKVRAKPDRPDKTNIISSLEQS